jgi:hypothetical protein
MRSADVVYRICSGPRQGRLAPVRCPKPRCFKEIFFVSILRCIFDFANRRRLFAFSFVALAGVCSSTAAQTAPQLLPYTVKLIAGGGTVAIASGATCPVSGYKSTDAYGDGCLATEVELTGPRYATVDKMGAIFFSDYANGLIRRIDPVTGIVTAVAGGAASSPASGTACGSSASTDALGDGCLGTAVELSHPTGLVFSPAGDLYFGDYGYANVRKVAAIAGVITTTGTISLIDGNPSGAYGYTSNFGTTTINPATQGYLDGPFGLAFDNAGNLYIADEYKEAVLVVNTNATGSTTVTGITIPAGTVAKIVGSVSAGGSVCPNSPASTNGCNYGLWTNGALANSSEVDSPWAVTFDPSGNVYFANEYEDNIGIISLGVINNSPAWVINNFAGEQGTLGKGLANTKRAAAGTFAIGASLGIAADSVGNIYIPDESNGFVWRVDAASQSSSSQTMYVVAGGATNVCSGAADALGDGCPALQATFSSTGTYGSNSSLGLYGVSVDANADLLVGDAKNGLIREVASGTQFGNVGAVQTDVVDVHFAAKDSAAAGGYTLTSGASIFSLGTPSCTTNSDLTTDCLLPITVTPAVLGAFTGTLQIQSQLNGTSSFPLTGNFIQSPVTRTVASTANSNSSCGSSNSYSTTAPVTLIASLVANGPSAPTGTIIFYANGTALAPTTGVTVSNIGTANAPVYGATLSYTFTTPATYSITATYSGNSYFKTSTSAATVAVAALPAFSTSANNYQGTGVPVQTVAPGQTALYSFNIDQTVYAGTIAFSATGLPANSSVVFSPSTITANGCSTNSTVALSILTQQGAAAASVSSLGMGGHGPWAALASLTGLVMALLIGVRGRRSSFRYRQLWMVLALLIGSCGAIACGNGVAATQATPAGTYPITITAAGSTGTLSSFQVKLAVN